MIQPVTWRTVARDLGWTTEEWDTFASRPYPNPAELKAAAHERSPDQLNGPTEGLLEAAARRLVVRRLRAMSQASGATLGLYSGYEANDDRLDAFPRVTVDGLPYAVVEGELGQVLDSWASDQPSETWWTMLVAFLWPNDRSWFVRIDPDSTFAAIGCDDRAADDLLADPALECREAV
ncbi:hypothetical protein GCM10028801_10230 [Nocardioides maradonensis]